MTQVIVHDPRLARAVYEAYAEIAGRSKSDNAYHAWLRRYVYPLARALGIEYHNPYDNTKRKEEKKTP